MAIPNTSEKSNSLDREENVTRGNLSGKRVVLYTYDSNTDTLQPYSTTSASGGKATDAYGINAISEDATYKYFWFEADDLSYYIMRKHKTTNVFTFTKGTGGYTSVYVDENSGPSGLPTWGTRGATF